jgi:RNA polymerase sigma-70 factor (ECF subfamily)
MNERGRIIALHPERDDAESTPLSERDDAESTPLSERDDDALMLLTRGGIQPAFDELVRRHQGRVLRIAGKYLGQPALARDVAQNTFLEVYRAVPRYRAGGTFTAYLYRVLVNQCRMTRRRARREERLDPLEGHVASGQPEQEDHVLAQERRKEVERALGQLSNKLRVVLVLRFAGELTYREIAEVLDLPLGTVKRRIFDGLERVRRIVEEGR